jgi:Domain of unknown function (DUF2703)
MSTEAIDLLFLEVDMPSSGKKSCGACDAAESRLSAALEVARPLLAEAGYEVRVNKVRVTTEEQARQLNFVGSPTLRAGGSEVAPRHVPGGEGRLWSWAGKEFAEPPVGLFLELILRSARADRPGTSEASRRMPEEIPSYLKRYLQSSTQEADPECRSCS